MHITGDTVEIQGQRYLAASRGQRLIGQFLDGIVYAGIVLAGVILGFLTLGLLGFVGGLAALAYALLQDGLGRGQSYAKKWMGLQVIDVRTGGPCTYGQSFIRNIILLALNFIDWVFIFGATRQRLGDRAAGTIVVVADGRSAGL
jgi:uncharacterized RDD family membrane protein YckC